MRKRREIPLRISRGLNCENKVCKCKITFDCLYLFVLLIFGFFSRTRSSVAWKWVQQTKIGKHFLWLHQNIKSEPLSCQLNQSVSKEMGGRTAMWWRCPAMILRTGPRSCFLLNSSRKSVTISIGNYVTSFLCESFTFRVVKLKRWTRKWTKFEGNLCNPR